MDRKPILKPNEQPLPRYVIHRLIGKGGLGEVYFATSDAGKEVALKLFTDGRGVQGRGARTILNLNHPNLVHLYDLATDDKGREWLVMEYVPGESVERRLARPPHALPPAEARSYFADMAAAVEHIHDCALVHRDLKPANLLLPLGTGRLKVVDFDLCRPLAGDPALTTRIGTPEYMAPEMHTGQYDHRVDIYAAGLILAEMLTGRSVFPADSSRSIAMRHEIDPPDLSRVPSERLRRVIARALEKDKGKRFATMREMAAEADAAFADLLAAPRTVPVAPPVPVGVAVPAATVPMAEAVPAGRTRQVAAGVVGGMLAAPLAAAATGVPLWLVLSGTDWPLLLRLLVTTTAVTWAALLAGAGVRARERVRWDRRAALAVCGAGIGALAYWMDGWPTPRLSGADQPGPAESYLFDAVRLPAGTFGVELRYLLFFTAAVFGPRWWRGSAPDRVDRFALLPLVEAALWGAGLLAVWPWDAGPPWHGLGPLVLAALAVQVVSPWVPTVAAQLPRKKRLKPVA